MLQLHRRGVQWQVAASGLHIFGQDVRQSPDLRWRQAVGAIDSLLSSNAFRGRRVVLCLGSDQVMIKNARLPKMPAADMGEAVRWEAADRFPFDVNAGILRFMVAGEVRQGGELRQEVLMLAASDQCIREQLRLLELAGCQPVGMDAQPMALARAVEAFWPISPSEDEPVRVLADLGAETCQLLVMRGRQVVFVKTIEIGSAHLTRAVAESVGTSFEDSHALRLRMGNGATDGAGGDESLAEGSKIHRAVTAAMRPVIERLTQEISLCLRYYSVTFRGNRPGTVSFAGGASHDQLLMPMLGEALGMTVQIAGPLTHCRPDEQTCQWGAGAAIGGPEWAAALGCCLKPLPNGKASVDPSAVVPAMAGSVGGSTAAVTAQAEPALPAAATEEASVR
ncbi:MAG: Cell division protein FtsA [Phycisphaerae bacterium]|nr:Cell division protein FtsA [Phycisphaerae bacterium]